MDGPIGEFFGRTTMSHMRPAHIHFAISAPGYHGVVTHLFQILAFMAMEPPTALEPAPISEEKNKVFRSMLPIQPQDVVRGQYSGYRSEEGVDPES